MIVKMDDGGIKSFFKNASKKFLKSAGAYIRKVACNSIKMRKKESLHSKPGTPPFYHGAKFGGSFNFKNSIQYTVEKDSAYIGPINNGLGALGALHEFGGVKSTTYIDHPKYGHKYQVGEVGPISTSKFRNWSGKSGYYDPLTGLPVAFVQLKSSSIAEHSTRLQARLLDADSRFKKVKMATYPARPFMRPAYAKSEPYLLNIFRQQTN